MSITSMTNRARLAEDLSISQLQQSIKDGVIPSYIGVPLLQEKVKDAKLLQAAKAAQSAMQQPSVAQQIMSQADQVEQGVPSLPTNLPVQGMAGGGIVAFADGGMYDDEEDSDEDRADADRRAEMDALMDEYAQTFQGGIGQLPAAAKAAPEGRGEDASDFIARIMHKESRGRRYGKDGELLTSEKGAKGEMQVMPGTSRDPGFGVTPARDNSPDELARVGRDYAKTLLERYGDPKLAAIAYNMGPGATDKWLAAGADVSKLPRETQGYVKGFSGEDGESKVEDKYKGVWPYNSPDAGKFSYGDTLDEDAKKALAFSSAPLAAAGDVLLSPITALRKAVRNPLDRSESPSWSPLYDARNRYLYGDEKKAEKATAEGEKGLPSIARGRPTMANDPRLGGAPAMQTENDGMTADARLNARIDRMLNPAEKATASPAAAVEKPDRFAKYEELFAKREENLAKQREQDKYMALLQAGLGMMGGTSQHALTNIGTGGAQGLAALAQSNAARTAEENAILSGRLGLEKIGATKDYQDKMMQLRKDLQKDVLAQRDVTAKAAEAGKAEARENRIDAKQIDYIKSANDRALANATKLVNAGTGALTMTDEQKTEAIQAAANKLLMSDKLYREYVKKQHGADPFSGGTMEGAGSYPEGAVRKIKG